MSVEEASIGMSVGSTIKSFSRHRDVRSAFQDLIANHSGEVKCRSILKKTLHLLQNVKWNGRGYPLERHVPNHRQAHDYLMEFSVRIEYAVPGTEECVECLIESINYTDRAL